MDLGAPRTPQCPVLAHLCLIFRPTPPAPSLVVMPHHPPHLLQDTTTVKGDFCHAEGAVLHSADSPIVQRISSPDAAREGHGASFGDRNVTRSTSVSELGCLALATRVSWRGDHKVNGNRNGRFPRCLCPAGDVWGTPTRSARSQVGVLRR